MQACLVRNEIMVMVTFLKTAEVQISHWQLVEERVTEENCKHLLENLIFWRYKIMKIKCGMN